MRNGIIERTSSCTRSRRRIPMREIRDTRSVVQLLLFEQQTGTTFRTEDRTEQNELLLWCTIVLDIALQFDVNVTLSCLACHRSGTGIESFAAIQRSKLCSIEEQKVTRSGGARFAGGMDDDWCHRKDHVWGQIKLNRPWKWQLSQSTLYRLIFDSPNPKANDQEFIS